MITWKIIVGSLFLTFSFAFTCVQASPDDEKEEQGIIIFDGTRDPSAPVLATNLKTGVEDDAPAGVFECDDDEAIELNICNGFEHNNVQMITGSSNTLTAHIGVNNPNTTSYDNKGTSRQFDLFGEDHLFDLDRFRFAANQLSLRNANTPAGTYGTISWQQFVQNVADGQTMYGIVRVLIPLGKIEEPEKYSSNGFSDGFIKVGRRDFSQQDYNRYKKSQSSSKRGRYGLCKKNQPKSKCGCTPNEETELEPGATVCGIKLGSQAKIDIRGALLFDFVDCEDMKPLALDNIAKGSDEFAVEIGVPIYINPANPDTDGTLRNLQQIAGVTSALNCRANEAHCSLPVTSSINWSLVSQQVKDDWLAETDSQLTRNQFLQLSKTEQYKLILPSGYLSGWQQAFQKLNIDKADWRTLGFKTPPGDGNFTRAEIASDKFEDIPVYMYSGGMVEMGFHINISGLIYIPQALELEQEDSETEVCLPYEHESNDDHGYDHKSDDCHEENEIDALQYVSGAIVVRDAFFIEAEHGTTLISNDPRTYSSMRIAASSGLAGKFKPVSEMKLQAGETARNHPEQDEDENPSQSSQQSPSSNSPSIEWIEIRP